MWRKRPSFRGVQKKGKENKVQDQAHRQYQIVKSKGEPMLTGTAAN